MQVLLLIRLLLQLLDRVLVLLGSSTGGRLDDQLEVLKLALLLVEDLEDLMVHVLYLVDVPEEGLVGEVLL